MRADNFYFPCTVFHHFTKSTSLRRPIMFYDRTCQRQRIGQRRQTDEKAHWRTLAMVLLQFLLFWGCNWKHHNTVNRSFSFWCRNVCLKPEKYFPWHRSNYLNKKILINTNDDVEEQADFVYSFSFHVMCTWKHTGHLSQSCHATCKVWCKSVIALFGYKKC